MRSKVLDPCCVERAVRAYPWRAKPDRKAAEDNLYQIALEYKYYESVRQIAAGDIVSIAMESDAPKFNHSVKLQVCGNLFDSVLEAALPGKRVGRQYRLAHPAGQITYTVQQAQRLVVPTVSGDMVKALNIPGVTTPAQLRSHYLRESMKQALFDEVYDFLPVLLGKCVYDMADADLSEMDAYEIDRCRGISRSMGMVFDEMTEQQLLNAVGCPSIPEFRAMIHTYHGKTLRAALLEAQLSGKPAEELRPADVGSLYFALIDRITQCAMDQIQEDEIC